MYAKRRGAAKIKLVSFKLIYNKILTYFVAGASIEAPGELTLVPGIKMAGAQKNIYFLRFFLFLNLLS